MRKFLLSLLLLPLLSVLSSQNSHAASSWVDAVVDVRLYADSKKPYFFISNYGNEQDLVINKNTFKINAGWKRQDGSQIGDTIPIKPETGAGWPCCFGWPENAALKPYIDELRYEVDQTPPSDAHEFFVTVDVNNVVAESDEANTFRAFLEVDFEVKASLNTFNNTFEFELQNIGGQGVKIHKDTFGIKAGWIGQNGPIE